MEEKTAIIEIDGLVVGTGLVIEGTGSGISHGTGCGIGTGIGISTGDETVA